MKKQTTDRQRLKIIWWGMKGRCYDCNHIAFKYYGASGIKICEEWVNSFDNFYKWAILNGYKYNLTIDRFPNKKGNYEPSNCRWATKKQQANNRELREGGIDYGEGGLVKLSAELNIKYPTLQARFRRGWDKAKATDATSNFKLNNPLTSKPVVQYDMTGTIIMEYPSIKEITRLTSFKKPMLIHHLKGRRKQAYGFIWKYKTEV